MSALLLTLHVLICVALVIIVLLHEGKGAEVGAVFGGGQAMFGGEGPANFMNKLTSVVAIGFMLTSLGLALVSAHQGSASVVGDEKVAPITGTTSEQSPQDLDSAMEDLKKKAAEEQKAAQEQKAAPEATAPAATAPAAKAPVPDSPPAANQTTPEPAPAAPEGAPGQ
jgi:preprotein translocase subunit SecG